jgi:LuxR family transcriptional regulator, maltose regulon positive regulatory protein
MDSSLLVTRLRVPPTPRHVVPRKRLVDLLERDVPSHRLTLVSGPAGYGKTTLLSQWANTRTIPVAWLSLSTDENDVDRFFRYLLAAWNDVQPGISESTLGAILQGMMPERDVVLSAFINVASEQPHHTAFVLDDYHCIGSPDVHESLTFLIDNLPETLHFVLSSRADPPLPLARYRARTQLLELGPQDLAFQLEESGEFFEHSMRLALPADQVASLHGRLEGWIAGLQLVALSLRGRETIDEAGVISGRHRYITDYLSEDVLSQLPDEYQRFLLQTSILDGFNAALCDAVTERMDSQQMLIALERQNLFVTAMDDNRTWFRYHGLFADYLRDELYRRDPDYAYELHRRAGRWYLEHDFPELAFHHAVSGNDVDLTAKICDLYFNAKMLGGEFRTVQDWLSRLPVEWYAVYPVLGLARAGLLAFSGDVGGCIRCIDGIEQALAGKAPEEARWQQARVHTIRCFIACMSNDVPQAEKLADLALSELPEENLGFRPGIYAALGDVYRQNGRWDDAYKNYLKVLEYSDSPSVRTQSAHVYGALADLSLRQGRLRDAGRYWEDALSTMRQQENWGRISLPVIGWIYIRLAEIFYEWNRLDEAWSYVESGIQRAELGGDVRALIAGYLISGRLKLSSGDHQAAAEYLERARPLVEQVRFHEWITRFERFQLEVWLSENRLRTAVDWVDLMMKGDVLRDRPEREIAEIALARALIFKGDSVSVRQGCDLLDRLIPTAESEGRNALLIEGLTLRSLAESALGDQAAALSSLEHALRLAEPEGYVRLFVDLGRPMGRLLQLAQTRHVMPDYTETILGGFGQYDELVSDTTPALTEPLTDREQEILVLLAAGLTNSEIAGKFFISPETVKKHTANIYGKLHVRRRTEAVARARELNLLA